MEKIIGASSDESEISEPSASQDISLPQSSSQPNNSEQSDSQDTNPEQSISQNVNVLPSSSTSLGVENNIPINEEVYKEEMNKYIHSWSVQQKEESRNHVYCKVCVKYPEIVKRYRGNKNPGTIVLETGIRHRKQYVWEHFLSEIHKKCKEAKASTC